MATFTTLALLLLLPLASALAMRDNTTDVSAAWSPLVSTGSAGAVTVTVVTDIDTGIAKPTPPATTLFTNKNTKTTPSCDLMYCDSGTSYCIYWGGYSSYDYTEHHPIPGETRTAIGTCRRPTAATPTTYAAETGVV